MASACTSFGVLSAGLSSSGFKVSGCGIRFWGLSGSVSGLGGCVGFRAYPAGGLGFRV